MSSVRQILVFGIDSGISPIKFADSRVSFENKEFSGHLADYDIVIYRIGTFEYEYSSGIMGPRLLQISAEAIRRENEIRSALEAGKTICFIGADFEDYVFSGILDAYQIQHWKIYEGNIFRNLRAKKSEFKSFLDDLGATTIEFDENTIDDVICTINENRVVGFSKRIGKGLLLYLPCVWGSIDIDYVTDRLKKLVSGLISYSTKLVLEPPRYVEDFQFTNEKVVGNDIDRIKTQKIIPLEEKLRYYSKIKSILWLGNNNLVGAIVGFFKELGFQTLIDEIYEEDFWILDKGKKLIIVEVKGLSKNLTRQDLSKLDEHREAREVPNLTGLLIANTFMTANSIEIKDQPFAPNVIEKAVSSNLIITRTIDLCKIYDQFEGSMNNLSETLLNTIIGRKGWLTLKDGKIVVSS